MNTDTDLVDAIENIRVSNNILWMRILRIALQYASRETKDILRQIKVNDLAISQAVGKLADED